MVRFGTMTDSSAPVFASPLRLANFNTYNPKTSLHFAETYVFRPKQFARFGELFVVLQIDHSTKTSPQVGDAIATIMNHEYFRGNPTNVVQNLEDSLHKTNEILSDLAARGEIHWIGKLHGVIGVFQKDAVHLSATGRGKAFLIRDGEVAEITGGLYDSSRAASPMKTFENLASGELREGDSVLLTTPGITDYLSPETLRSIIEQRGPEAAAKVIQDRVGHDSSTAHAAVVFSYSQKSAPQPAAVSASTASIHQPIKSTPAANIPAKPSEEPLIKTYQPSVAATPSFSASKPAEPATEMEPALPKAPLATSTPAQSITSDSIAKKRSPMKKLTGLFSRKSKRSAISQEQTDRSTAATEPRAKSSKLSGRLKKAVIRMPAKAKVFTALALLLVVVFVVSLFVFTGVRSTKADRQALRDKLGQAQQLEEDAAAAIIFKSFTDAQEKLTQAEGLIAELPENDKELTADIETLKGAIATDYEKLSGSSRIDEPTVLASFVSSPKGIALLGEELIAWSASGKIEVASTNNGDTATGGTIGTDLGDPVVGAIDETELVIVTDQDQLVGFEDGDLNQLDLGSSIDGTSIVAAETYGGRLYVLDPKDDSITRFTRTLAGYGQGGNWVLDGTSVEDGVDLAIDGNIWVLLSDGRVLSFLQGSQEEFTLGPVVDPLESPTKIVTSEDASFLYILEPSKNRLLQFDKEKGDFVKQFVSDSFTDLKDVVINEDGGLAYLLNGDTIFQIDLNK